MDHSLAKTILEALSSFDEPPTVTDLRFRAAGLRPFDYHPEEVRAAVFQMLRSGSLKLTEKRRIYR